MESNTDSDTKKQSVVSSTKMNVFADEDTDKSEKQPHDLPCPILKPANPNVLADASNKLEAQQQDEQQDPQLAFKKKKKGYYKKKYYKNKNKNAWNPAANKDDNNNDVRDQRYRDHHQQHQRGNNQAYFPHEEANTFANHNDPTQFPQPFSRYIPGSQHEFPIPHPSHPQPQRHHFADDGNAKVLLEQYSNGVSAGGRDFVPNDNSNVNGPECNNWVAAAPVSNYHPLFSWVDMIDNNTQLDGVVIMHGGVSKFVPLARDVGACLVKELLVQKENFQESVHHNHDPNAYANVESEQGRPVQEYAGGAQGLAPTPIASTDHQAFPVVQRGSVPSSVTTSGHPQSLSYPHQRPNDHPDQYHHYNVHAPIFNPQQPYNGFGSLPAPAPDDNYGMHIAPPPSHYPMMQYSQMYSQMGMPGPAAAPQQLGSVTPGYARPNDFYTDGQHNAPTSSAAMRGENYIDNQRRGDGRHPASNNRNNMKPNLHRAGINQGDATEGGNRPQVHHHNQNAVTPHREAVRGNGRADPRRVSFSPMPRALAASTGCNM